MNQSQIIITLCAILTGLIGTFQDYVGFLEQKRDNPSANLQFNWVIAAKKHINGAIPGAYGGAVSVFIVNTIHLLTQK